MAILIKKDGTEQSGLVDDDVVQPFRLESANVRGRMVRLGPVLADIMRRHAYPPPVSALLCETVALALLLSAMLKYDGIFTLQIKGDGPVRLLIADVTAQGEIRAYAGFDDGAVRKAARRAPDLDNRYYHLLGTKGYIAFTVDPGDIEKRYQGIVELKGESLAEAVQHYFDQSEQVKTAFKIAVHPQDGQWKAAGLMIQQMPPEDAATAAPLETDVEDFRRASILMQTCTESEMLSPVLHSADVLFRLFHEDGVRVYSPTHVRFKCRCDRGRVTDILRAMPRAEIEEICRKDGQVSVTCEFCAEKYAFAPEQVDALYKEEKT